jgi:hypothetical protein
MRSRGVRLVARLLIVVLYLNGLAPMLGAAGAAAASSGSTTWWGGGSGGSGGSGATVPLFGPKRYTRTSGFFNLFTDQISVPNWIRSPYVVRIKNGESDGSNRVTGAFVFLSGLPVATPLDFNQNTDTVERPVLLLPILVQLLGLSVKVYGPTGSYVTVTVLGRSGDTAAPSLTITEPPANTTTNDTTPNLAVTYGDANQSDCQASGIDTSTLKVTLDGIDRTSLFTATPSGAQATIPDNLALSGGTHALHVEIRDRAGNLATADRTFSVISATQPPTLTITAPADDKLVKDASLTVSGTVAAHGSGPLAVQCRVGEHTTSAVISGGANWSCSVNLIEGDNAIVVSATDSGGTSEATRHVVLDATKPAVAITSPEPGAYTTAETVTVTGTVSDAHDVTVTVNGVAATVTGNTFEATVPVGNGPTVDITAVAVDAAGNERPATITLNVRRDDLEVKITGPAPGATVRGPMLEVRGTTNRDLPVFVAVNGIDASVAPDGAWTAVNVPVLEGEQSLQATAHDAAGRTDDDVVTVRVDSAAPEITVDEPTSGLVTFADKVRVAGRVSEVNPGFTLTLNGEPVELSNGQFSVEVTLPTVDGATTLTLVATDGVGNSATTPINVIVDRTKPTLTIVSPERNAVIAGLPIVVQGTVDEANGWNVTVDGTPAEKRDTSWRLELEGLPDGPRTFVVRATDAAGNVTEDRVTVTLDTAAPVLTVTTPEPDAFTRVGTIEVAGTVQDSSDVDILVTPGDLRTTASNGTFSLNVPVKTNDDTSIVVTAIDKTGRTSTATIVVTHDGMAPEIELTAPGRLTRRESVQATATVSDAHLAQVVWAINGAAAGMSTAAPFELPLTIPDGVAIGGTFKVSVTAIDRAGNVATDSVDVRVVADGAIVGQVLSDATGLPLEGATVHIGSDTRPTDAQGRYTLPTDRASIVLSIERNEMTSVSRVVSMASGVGTVPVDARLTPLAAEVIVGAEGSVLTALSTVGSGPATPSPAGSGSSSGSSGSTSTPSAPTTIDPLISIVVPATVAGVGMRLTPLSAQGLPDLLPLGWSPIAAFDLRAAAAVQGDLTLRATFAQAQAAALGGTLTLVEYRSLLQSWVVVRRDLAPNATHIIETGLPGTGAFALVMPDMDPPIVVPAEGDPLIGVSAIEIPIGATTQGSVEPAVIPPTGGTARGQLRVDSPAPLPSGTLVQAEVTERFTLPSSQIASEEQRRQDIVLYRAPGRTIAPGAGNGSGDPGTPAPEAAPAVSGTLPITPSRTFDPVSLVEGRVHLDILAGRESVRGLTGGREAVTVSDADARLVVPANALDNDTAVTLRRQSFSAFLPAHAALTPLSELLVDVPGPSLNSPAELSIAASGTPEPPDTALVIARVDRVDGVPFLTVVARAEVSGGRIIATATSGLPGVTGSGRYVFYRVAEKLGFVEGITSAGGQPTVSVVSTNSLPFIARGDRDGRYTVASLAAGTNVIVTARVPRTSLEKSGSVIVNPTPNAGLNLELAPTATRATVVPADGTSGVSREPQITLTTPIPIRRDTVTAENVRLLKVVGTNTTTVVPARAVLAGSGQTLSIVPNARLEAGTEYQIDVSGLTDVYGGVVAVDLGTFRTAVESAPTYSPDYLTFSLPDAEGVVTIASRPDKFFPLGVQFLIINSRSGDVVSFGTNNDGSVSGRIGATVDDRLVITITDPDGRVTTVTRSQFVDPATGRTAIGPGGGTVEGPDGIELRVPEGAVTRAVTLKITPLGADDFPANKPDVPDATFGSGIRIEASGVTRFAKEAKLVFPIPDALEAEVTTAGKQLKDAFFYVFNRGISDDDGEPIFETLDYAEVEGDGDTVEGNEKIVTASFPFSGLIDVGGMAAGYAFVMWSFNQALPGQPTTGVITGRVLRPVFQSGAADPTYVGVPGARVELVDPVDTRFEPRTGAITQADGRYTIFDHRFVGGSVSVKTTVGGETARATVFAVQSADTKVLADPALAVLVSKGAFKQIATANLTLPPAQPQLPAPALTVRVMKTVEGRRVDTRGLVGSGTPLIVGIDAGDAEVSGVIIAEVGAAPNAGTSYAVQPDPALQQSPRDPLAMPFVTSEPFTPSQAGSYDIRVSALPAFGPPVTTTVTIRVLGAGGGVTTDPNLPPSVITAQTVPVADAVGVPVTIVPQIAFTEPVLHIPGNVFLRDASGAAVPIKISGVGVDANGQLISIEEVTSAATVVTGLTIQPRFGLAYGAKYQLELTTGIVDRDPLPDGPRSLVPFTSSFTTFSPETIGGTEAKFSSPGLVVLGERAYVLETYYFGGIGGNQTGALRTFDVGDPVEPREIAGPVEINAAPRDIAGEQHRVAVVTTPHTWFNNERIESGPSNLLLYDVSGLAPQWIGAASLTDGITDGTPNRVVIKDDMAYIATSRKGLQVVDLTETALGDLATAPGWEQSRRLNAPGEGVNHQALVAEIAVTDPAAPMNIGLADLKVGDYLMDGVNRRLVVATGTQAALGLVIIYPAGQEAEQIVAKQELKDDKGSLVAGQAIALTQINERNLAIVGGHGTKGNAGASGVVAVVDLSPLSQTPQGTPSVIAWVGLTHGVGDILIYGTTAIVSAPSTNALGGQGTATLINLADPYNPINAGTLTGLGSRLALANNVLVSTDRTLLKGTQGLSGVRTTGLGTLIMVTKVTPTITPVDAGMTEEPIRVQYRVLAGPQGATGSVNLFRTASPVATTSTPLVSLPLPSVQDGTHEVELPANIALDLPSRELNVEITLPDGSVESFLTTIRNPAPRPLGAAPANGNAADFAPRPDFLTLTPNIVGEGAPLTRITVEGTTLSGITHVQVRRGEDWRELKVASVTATSVTFDLPTELAAEDGFLLVAPTQDESSGIPLMVAAPNLPTPATNEAAYISGAGENDAIGPGQTTVTLTGGGFAPGMQVVLGLGERPGVVLTTEFVSETELRATLPPTFIGESYDLVAGVMTPDGGALSTLLPVWSHYPDPADELIDTAQAREEAGQPVEPTASSMHGTLHWNSANERLEFEGLGLTPGLEVRFSPATAASTMRAARALSAISGVTIATNTPPSREELTRVAVEVPRELTAHPFFTIGLTMQQPGQAPVQSAPAAVPMNELNVPFGGRGDFHVYSDAGRKEVFLLASNEPTMPYPGAPARPPLNRLSASDFTVTLTDQNNPLKPSGLRVVRREKNSKDPDGVFLRGTGLTGNGVDPAKLTIALSSQTTVSREVKIKVVEKPLGQSNENGHYKDLIVVADLYGVPPQFLKAQAKQESTMFTVNFRYEPITRDFEYMGGTGSGVMFTSSIPPVATTRRIETEPWASYRQKGTMLRRTLLVETDREIQPDANDNRTFNLGVRVARSVSTVVKDLSCTQYQHEPKDKKNPKKRLKRWCIKWDDAVKDPAVTAKIRKTGRPKDETLTLVHTYPVWRKVEHPSRFAPQGWLQPAATLDATRFTIDYATGTITLGRALAADEKLLVTYRPIPATASANGNVLDVSTEGKYAADFYTQANQIKETVSLKYTKAETFAAFLSNNIRNTGTWGGWLTGTLSERRIEFKVGPDGKPIEALDPKFEAMTANPAGSASYGTLQVLVEHYTMADRHLILKALLDPANKSMYPLYTDWLLGLKLGAAIHQSGYAARKAKAPCKETDTCTTENWYELWHEILKSYNPNGEGYNDKGIFNDAQKFEPKP